MSLIDLSTLPPPTVVQPLNFETIFAAMLADLQARFPEFDALLESDPAYKILEVCAYRELLQRQDSNDACLAVMVAYSGGTDLENLGALFGVVRLVLTPADNSTIPPTPAVMEDDTALRRRIQLSLDGLSTAGPAGAYLYHTLSASGEVLDASATSPEPGEVVVTVLSRVGNGEADSDLLAAVEAALSAETVRPLTDHVTVQGAEIVPFAVEAVLYIYPGPDSSVVLSAAQAALQAYLESVHRIGLDVSLSGIYAALHRPGVQRVELAEPADPIIISQLEASFCTGISLTIGGTDE